MHLKRIARLPGRRPGEGPGLFTGDIIRFTNGVQMVHKWHHMGIKAHQLTDKSRTGMPGPDGFHASKASLPGAFWVRTGPFLCRSRASACRLGFSAKGARQERTLGAVKWPKRLGNADKKC